jgi:hypothetical protein
MLTNTPPLPLHPAPPSGRSRSISTGGSTLIGCAVDPPRRLRHCRCQPAPKGLTLLVASRFCRKHRHPRRPCRRIWPCAPIYSSSVVTTVAQSGCRWVPSRRSTIGARPVATRRPLTRRFSRATFSRRWIRWGGGSTSPFVVVVAELCRCPAPLHCCREMELVFNRL